MRALHYTISYLARCMQLLENQLKVHRDKPIYDGALFTTKKVVDYLTTIDDTLKQAIERVLVEFTNHRQPLIPIETMREWISAAPAIFGPLWCLLCNIRGIKPTHEREKGRTDDKIHSVLFELLTMARISNRKRLIHWAIIQNITLLARGVGRAAESAVSYFGFALSNTPRRRLFDNISGNDEEGQAQKKTLRDRQCSMFRTCAALIFAYNNYQKSLSLQHQRGKHSSAFFKGTHECAYKVLPFTDCTFDEMYAMFTQHDQDIPSPCVES